MKPPYIDVETLFGLDRSLRTGLLPLVYILLAVWLKLVVARLPLGLSRLVGCLPLLAAGLCAPFIFSVEEILPRTSMTFILSWLANFKVLAFCLGREPLRETMTVAQVAAILLLPVFPKSVERGHGGPEGRLQDSAGSGAGLLARWVGKLVLLGAVVFAEVYYAAALPRVALHYLHAFGLYAFVGFLQDGPAAVAVEALGLQLVPTFDQPWLSSSLADFWGRRWNIPTSTCLRTLVYDPIIDGALIAPGWRRSPHGGRDGGAPPPPPGQPQLQPPAQQSAVRAQPGEAARAAPPRPSMLRRQLGLHASFLASGLIHEYIAWSVSGAGWGWKWSLFFYVQAPLMTAEGLGRRLLARAGVRRLPRLLTTLLTLALLEATAYDLFFGFVDTDTNMAQRVLAACMQSYSAALRPLAPLLQAAAAAVGVGWQQ